MPEAIRVRELRARAYTMPTDAPEADGTIEWDSTTIVVATVRAGDAEGIGYTYAAPAAASVIATRWPHRPRHRRHGPAARLGRHAPRRAQPGPAGPVRHRHLRRGHRSVGPEGEAAGPAAGALLGRARDAVPLYGSGGFTSYDDAAWPASSPAGSSGTAAARSR